MDHVIERFETEELAVNAAKMALEKWPDHAWAVHESPDRENPDAPRFTVTRDETFTRSWERLVAVYYGSRSGLRH